MNKEEKLIVSIKKEMIRLIRAEELEFKLKNETFIVQKVLVKDLLESQSLEILNLLYPKDADYNVLEEDCLEECTETDFDGIVNVPNVGTCTFKGSAEVKYKEREFLIALLTPVNLYVK